MEKKTEVLSISSGENILRYEGKSLPREAEETSKNLHLFLFFLFWYSSLTNLQCKFPLVLHVNHLLWDVWIWGKGSERVAEGCSSVWAELCARSGSWLGSAGFLSVPASASSIHQWAKHKTLGAKLTFKGAITNTPSWCASSSDTATLWPQHRVMPCALHYLNLLEMFEIVFTQKFPCSSIFLSTQGR